MEEYSRQGTPGQSKVPLGDDDLTMLNADGTARRDERAQQFFELATAIDAAQRLAWRLGTAGRCSREALDLYCQLDAARDELEKIRGGPWQSRAREIGPKRIRS